MSQCTSKCKDQWDKIYFIMHTANQATQFIAQKPTAPGPNIMRIMLLGGWGAGCWGCCWGFRCPESHGTLDINYALAFSAKFALFKHSAACHMPLATCHFSANGQLKGQNAAKFLIYGMRGG